jgi:hypothetical protein
MMSNNLAAETETTDTCCVSRQAGLLLGSSGHFYIFTERILELSRLKVKSRRIIWINSECCCAFNWYLFSSENFI